MHRSWLLVAVMALMSIAACGGNEADVEDSTPSTEPPLTTTSAGADEPQSTTTTTTQAPVEAPGESMGTIVVDGETFEFTDVYECQVGQDGGSPDYREFGARTEDGSADVSIAYFPPDDAFASLTGVSMDREVDGSDWTYASSYAGSEAQFTVNLTDSGASGTAEIGVVGLGNPYGGDTLITEWSFSCG